MRILFTFLLIAGISSYSYAQGEVNSQSFPGRTSFIAEVGGAGIVFSANIDHRFKKSIYGWGGRIGLGFTTGYTDRYDPVTGWYDYEDHSVVTVPVMINYIFGRSSSPHGFEVGGGLTYVGKELEIMNFYDGRESQLFGTFAFMYRRQPVNGGFSWRVGFTPLVAKGYIQPFAGASVGYNF